MLSCLNFQNAPRMQTCFNRSIEGPNIQLESMGIPQVERSPTQCSQGSPTSCTYQPRKCRCPIPVCLQRQQWESGLPGVRRRWWESEPNLLVQPVPSQGLYFVVHAHQEALDKLSALGLRGWAAAVALCFAPHEPIKGSLVFKSLSNSTKASEPNTAEHI